MLYSEYASIQHPVRALRALRLKAKRGLVLKKVCKRSLHQTLETYSQTIARFRSPKSRFCCLPLACLPKFVEQTLSLALTHL